MTAISSHGVIFSRTRRTSVTSGNGIVEFSSTSPLNSIKSSMLKMGLIPNLEGNSITYALVPNFLVTLKRPAQCACSLVKLPGGNHSGLKRKMTISPSLNFRYLRFAFAEVA